MVRLGDDRNATSLLSFAHSFGSIQFSKDTFNSHPIIGPNLPCMGEGELIKFCLLQYILRVHTLLQLYYYVLSIPPTPLLVGRIIAPSIVKGIPTMNAGGCECIGATADLQHMLVCGLTVIWMRFK